MQRPLKITSRDFALSAAFETEIREKAAGLETFYPRLSGCEVTVHAPAIKHHRKGGPFLVTIRLTLPGGELVARGRQWFWMTWAAWYKWERAYRWRLP